MIAAFLQNLLEAFRAPRASARRILDRAPSLPDCFLMVVLAFAVQTFFGLAFDLAAGGEAGSLTALGARLSELAIQFLVFLLLTGGAYVVGRRFGGTATPIMLAQVIAWHSLVNAFLAPLSLAGVMSMRPDGTASIGFLLVPLSLGISIWLFAAFVAEAHGFRSIGGVVVASVVGFVALAAFLLVLLSVLTALPASA